MVEKQWDHTCGSEFALHTTPASKTRTSFSSIAVMMNPV
jgi:hypothetical protein